LQDPATASNPQGGTIAETMLNATGDINCNTCHEQHNDRRFDLIGDSNKDDPEQGDTSEEHNFLIMRQGACRVCHARGSQAAAFSEAAEEDASRAHHFPGRDDPWGDTRSAEFSCNKCHDLGDGGGNHTHPCAECHNDFPVRAPGEDDVATMATGHHGASRHSPYINCVACHADPVTGLLTGNDFGTAFAPSCFECHGDLWFSGDTAAPTINSVNGVAPDGELTLTADELSEFTCDATDPDSGEQPLAYSWNFGDGSTGTLPSFDNETTHTYEIYNYYKYGADYPTITLTVAVTDGVNPPVTASYNVVVKPPASTPSPDEWTVTVDEPDPTPDEVFDIEIEEHNGSLVVVYDSGQLAYGIQFNGVIFWMELWMDLNDDAYWGTGDMYFGNIGNTMEGVVFRTNGDVRTFTAD